MSQTLENIEVFVASPADVSEERDLARSLVNAVDGSVARRLGYTLQYVGWEMVRPGGLAADGQEVINRQIVPKDVFVGIM